MKVAYLVNQYPKTSHTFVRRELQALEAQGAQVLRYSMRRTTEPLASPEDREELQRTRVILDEGAVGHLLAIIRQAVKSPGRFLAGLRCAIDMGRKSDRGVVLHLIYLAEACVLLGWLKRERVEHLHAHFGTNSAATAALVRALGGPPYSFTVHGPDEFDKPQALKLREKAHLASFVVAISHYGRAQLCRWVRHEDWGRLQVVRCGVADDLLGTALTPVPDVPRFVCVARISEQKGHLLLIDAAHRLAHLGIRFEIFLAGDGEMRGQVETLIREKGLEDRVFIGGWMSGAKVREALLGARAMVLPSFAEGLPVVIMEALALGRPVVTTAIAGTPELVQPGRTGWLVPAGSVEALVAAMKECLETPVERLTEMGRIGAELVARQHNVSLEAGKLGELIRLSIAGTPVTAESLASGAGVEAGAASHAEAKRPARKAAAT